MALLGSIPRALVIRTPQALRPSQHLSILGVSTTAIRYASSSSSPKTLSEQLRRRQQAQAAQPVLPQPDKYRPPSHGKRVSRSETGQRSYGPPLTKEDKERMRKKKYPNMMSPEGTFSHWFLNNKGIHVWITMGILTSLAVGAWYMDFMAKTIYADLLPSRKDFFRHPIQSCRQSVEVYRMHILHQSQVTAEKRLKKQEEVEKRKQYRLERIREAEERGEEYQEDPRYYVDENGVRRRRVKRWFGIWE